MGARVSAAADSDSTEDGGGTAAPSSDAVGARRQTEARHVGVFKIFDASAAPVASLALMYFVARRGRTQITAAPNVTR